METAQQHEKSVETGDAGARLLRADNLHELGALFGAAFVCVLYYVSVSARPVLLQLFFLPVVISALLLGRYRSCLIAALCLIFVVSVGEPVAPQLPGLMTAVWAAVLSLTAILTGGLSDEKNAAMERLWQRNRKETYIDELTQVSNRRAFNNELARRADEHARLQATPALVLIDVDRFKQFNDRFGHLAGDSILKQLAGVLSKTVRSTDLVARYGGEEFALLLPQVDSDRACGVAEKVRAAVESHWFEFRNSKYRITVSVGVACMQEGDDCEQLTQRADAALYTSKQSGRNCAHFHDGTKVAAFGDRLPTATEEPPAAQKSDGQQLPSRSGASGLVDPETGLPRREMFTNELVRRVAEVHRYGGAISVMFVEIVPAEEGANGEAVNLMRSVTAECIRNLLRTTDQGTQFRATEFAIMLPCTELSEALIPALRLRNLVNQCEKPIYQGSQLEFTVAIGVARITDADKPGPLMHRLAKLAAIARGSSWGVVSDQANPDEVERLAAELMLSQ